LGALLNPELRGALGRLRSPLGVLGGLLAIFLLLPLIIIVPTSWTAGQLLEFPPQGFSLQWYRAILESPQWLDGLGVSVRVGLAATVLATVSGTAAALAIRRLTGRRTARVLNSLFIVPLAIPYVAYALGLYEMFVVVPALMQSTWPLVCGQAVISFPYVYILVSAGLGQMDPDMPKAAAAMGARWPTIVWRIELPLIRTSVLAGAIFAFVTCFDEATLPLFIAPVDQKTLPQMIYSSARESISPELAAVSTAVTVFALLILWVGTVISPRGAPKEGR
jgi:putative spermidine/putrescine transport system permease protein